MDTSTIANVAQSIAKSFNSVSDKESKSIIKNSLKILVRQYPEKLGIYHASEAAIEKANELNIKLEGMTWANQSKQDPNRKIFIMEHKVTVADMVSKIIDNPSSALSVLSSAQLCWVLREEDAKLKNAGFQKHRKCSDEAYAQCGIKPVLLG